MVIGWELDTDPPRELIGQQLLMHCQCIVNGGSGYWELRVNLPDLSIPVKSAGCEILTGCLVTS